MGDCHYSWRGATDGSKFVASLCMFGKLKRYNFCVRIKRQMASLEYLIERF